MTVEGQQLLKSLVVRQLEYLGANDRLKQLREILDPECFPDVLLAEPSLFHDLKRSQKAVSGEAADRLLYIGLERPWIDVECPGGAHAVWEPAGVELEETNEAFVQCVGGIIRLEEVAYASACECLLLPVRPQPLFQQGAFTQFLQGHTQLFQDVAADVCSALHVNRNGAAVDSYVCSGELVRLEQANIMKQELLDVAVNWHHSAVPL